MLVHFSEKQFILRNVCINLLPQWSADDCLMLHLDWKDQWGDDKSNNHVDNRYKTAVRFPYFNFFFFSSMYSSVDLAKLLLFVE